MHEFCHIEIPTTDIEKSKKFYADVFGWKMQHDPKSDYWMFDAGGGVGGGFVNHPYIGSGTILPYIAVASVESTLERIVAAGGAVFTPKTEIPGMGWFAIFRDPVGVKVGLYVSAQARETKPAAKTQPKKTVAKKPAKKAPAKKVAKKVAPKKVAKKAPAKKPAAKKPVKKAAIKPKKKK
jgi:predicted enzyme related to lactoylglutathione lyase